METDVRRTLDDLLLEGLPDLVNATDLAARAVWPQGYTHQGVATLVGRWLRSVGARRHRRYTAPGRQPITLWSLRDHDRYAAMGPAARLALYLEGSR